MDTIKFANGAIYDCPYLDSADGGNAHIALSGVSVAEAASIFSDEEMTAEIEYGNKRLIGYTTLTMLTVQPYGIEACLKGGYNERIN